jgi:hypothetical protein
MAPASSIRTEVRISAPAEKVWAKLIDTSTWPDWNTFIPQAEVLDEPSTSSDGPQNLALGSRRRFILTTNGMKPSIQKVTVFEIPNNDTTDPKLYRICWAVQGYPDSLLRTLRFNEVEEVLTSDGKAECVYRTGEDQWGALAYVVKLMFGKSIEKGIRDWAQDLKKAAENDQMITT